MTALNGTTGAIRWTYVDRRLDVMSSPAIGADGTVFVVSASDPLLFAFNGGNF